MTEHNKQRRKMVENNARFRTFYLTNGRDFLQEILEVYTSPGHLYEKLVESDYFSSLSKSNQESLSSIKTENTFANLELEQIYDCLLNFTTIDKSDNEEEYEINPAVLHKNLNTFMALWSSVKSAHVMVDKEFKNNVNSLKNIGDHFATHFGFGKSFKETIIRDFEDIDERPFNIQLVSSGKDVNVQIGQNNKCVLNVDVFDHLKNEEEPTGANANDDLVKMIIHTSTTPNSGIEVAQIEKKLLSSLSGEQLEKINKTLQERFGIQIVVARKGCVVLVLQKTQLIANCLKDENMVKKLVSVLFELVGFSNDNLSEISLRVDLTLGDYADVDAFKKSQLKGKGLELTLYPKTNIKSMPKERKKELVSTILCSFAGLNPGDESCEVQVEAHFMSEKKYIFDAKNIIFISGPVTVLPSAKIQFQTVYPPSINSAKGEWLITKNNLSRKIQFSAAEYCMRTSSGPPTIQTIEITDPVENESAYQLLVGTTKSNVINVVVDDSGTFATENVGNCLRFFELLTVGKEALQKSLDSMSGTFLKKWVNFEKFCKQRNGKFLHILSTNTPTSSIDLDVPVIYEIFRNTISISHPTKGWGQMPGRNDVKTADDIERVRIYHYKIKNSNSVEMKTDDFNDSSLDLIWAVQRLTAYDEQLIKKICGIMNKLYRKGKELEKMMANIKIFKEKAIKEEHTLRKTEGFPEVNLQKVPQVDIDTRVELKAAIRGFPRYHSVIWKKDEKNIDTTDPRYETSEDSNKNYAFFCIKSVKKEDGGKYTIEVQNQLGKGRSSQKLVIKGDLPKVTLNPIPSANVNDCLELRAVIESVPVYQKVIWTKDGEQIDIDEPKYEGSKKDANSEVLCINDVEEEDEGMYTIEVHNELGKDQSSQELKIIAEMIFISGPAVVSPSKTIFFRAYMSNRNPSKAKWWKIKDQLKTAITFDNKKFYFYQGSNGQNHKIEIHNAQKEDSATYEVTVDCIKSNKLCVQVDDSGKYSNCNLGNCLRLFALQDVSAEAMRNVFDNLPGTFKEKLNAYSQYQSISEWKEMISEPRKELKSSEDVDITLMYRVIRRLYHQNPQNGWGNSPGKHDISTADDIERIRHCRNRICHTDASGMETNLFNESVLDLLGAIRRLSNGDLKLLEDSCEILNRAFTKEEEIRMVGKLVDFKRKQEKWNQSLQREECRDKIYEIIQFHDVCDSSIIIWDNNSAATQIIHADSVCFMNRPLNLGEVVHIRGSPHYLPSENQIRIGLTNQDPKTIIETENKKKASKCELKSFNYCTCTETKHAHKNHCSKEFHFYISLCQEATLSICFNGTKQEYHSYKDVSTVHPLWLVIEPDGTETIWISNI